MATVETLANEVEQPEAKSFFGSAWRRWQKRRLRNRARHRSQVRFRLTREGVHFIGILVFIFVGAVIRDINLLILLAGVMIGLLVLQWRFNTSTLVGVTVKRRQTPSTSAGNHTEFELSLYNAKHWLSAWLVVSEDPIQKLLPQKQRLNERGLGLVDAVRPRSTSHCRYQLNFFERGRYRIGPTTLSTRFPLGLGRGWRTVDNASEIIVHPQQGKLTASINELYQQNQTGQARAFSQSGAHEGEFFGLRPWETGDSRRWIHWRTTARLGELSVRQFEQCQQRQICVMLDLYQDGSATDEACEKAISFLATIAQHSVRQGHDRLAVAVAAEQNYIFETVQSMVLVHNLMDKLAIVSPSRSPDMASAFRGLSIPILSNPYLLVVSTRADQMEHLKSELTDSVAERILSRVRTRWLNVSEGDLENFFEWIPNE